MTKPVTQFIARQAILDASKQIFAYELLYRDSDNNAFPVGVTDEQATGRMFFNSLILVGKDKLVANHCAFINLSDTTLLQEIPRLLKPDNLVLEIVERSQNIEELLAIVKTLRKQNYKFALDDYDKDPRWEPLLPYMSYVKLELEHPILKTTTLAKKLKRLYPKLKIVVERIETYEDFNYLQQAGVDLFQGYFFAKPEMLTHGNVEPSKLVVFDLLKSTTQPNLNFKEIESKIAKDLSLTARVLKLVNAHSGLDKQEMRSISQAVVYLGEDTLRQFIRVLALSDLGVDKPSELTKFGLMRAQFMSLFLAPGGKEMAEQGYLIGLMSILGAVLDMDLNTVISEFSLDSNSSGALLNYDGLLGGALKIAMAIEENNWQAAESILAEVRPATPISSIFELAEQSRTYADDVFAVVSG
ncbi:HDOD domain-containing protein [Pseudoalteromonas sp. MMG024]|uniref:EAL and HDOD domain-containing protein n=1 Tax=Pseudoalteromonas sp. MMG024 TaxID=2909980 RepID=UPI001F46A692|nr:HDOD domain-containing protein [Pseudoalteromonas sp. MMG024]MCF6457172.1 HDOD domain-containing protein [Pseudoalteromonas sp. MMG024]